MLVVCSYGELSETLKSEISFLFYIFNQFIKVAGCSLKKTNVFLFSKETTNKGKSLQMFFRKVKSTENDFQNVVKNILSSNRYFGATNAKVSLVKRSFPKIMFIYFNQAYRIVKKVVKVLHVNLKILRQFMSSIGSPPKVSKHELTGDKVKIVQPLYDAKADMSQETVGFISLGWDTYE